MGRRLARSSRQEVGRTPRRGAAAEDDEDEFRRQFHSGQAAQEPEDQAAGDQEGRVREIQPARDGNEQRHYRQQPESELGLVLEPAHRRNPVRCLHADT